MRAGTLDRRITILRKSTVQNDSGEEIESWTAIAVVCAGKRDVRAAERYGAEQVIAEIETVFVIRPLPFRLTADRHRILFDGRQFNILGVTEPFRGEGFEIAAAARAEESLSNNG